MNWNILNSEQPNFVYNTQRCKALHCIFESVVLQQKQVITSERERNIWIENQKWDALLFSDDTVYFVS